MPNKDGSAVDEFLNQVNEGEPKSLVEPEKDPFANLNIEHKGDDSSQQNEENKGGEDKGDKPVPYHQDPKLRKFIAKEIAKATEGMSAKQVDEVKKEVSQSNDPLAALTAIIGNDTPEKVNALNSFKTWMEDIENKSQSAVRQIEAEQKAEREAEAELEKGFDSIEEDFDIDISSNDPQARKTRAEFIDFLERVAPKNQYGEIVAYPDFHETFSLFQEKKARPATANRAKDLAARSMERSGDASKSPIPADSSWKAVDKFFSTLKSK